MRKNSFRISGQTQGMLETSARLLRLLSLLEARRDWTGPQLAERLGVTTRTVRNDVERLRQLGYPVDAAPGVSGGYRLGMGAALPPLLLDDDEAVAVAIGLRTAAGGAAGTCWPGTPAGGTGARSESTRWTCGRRPGPGSRPGRCRTRRSSSASRAGWPRRRG